MVVTGAAAGIMEAGHVGASRENDGAEHPLALRAGGQSDHCRRQKLVHMKYFFTRKLMFVKESDAICLLPGGFGTLDEGLEVLTLLANRQARPGAGGDVGRAGRRLLGDAGDIHS